MGKRKFENVNVEKQLVYAVWVSDTVYVGSGYYERLSGNLGKLRRDVHANKQLQDAYNKIKDVKIEILADGIETKREARKIEDYYIEYFKKIDGVMVCNTYRAVTKEFEYKRVLTKEDVIEIKKAFLEGKNNKELANTYGVTEEHISRIRSGSRWGSVKID